MAQGPSGSPAGSGIVGAPAETARRKRNTAPASVEPGSEHIPFFFSNDEAPMQIVQFGNIIRLFNDITSP